MAVVETWMGVRRLAFHPSVHRGTRVSFVCVAEQSIDNKAPAARKGIRDLGC